MELTQKVDYFTVFESFPPNKIENLASWTYEVVSGMFTLGGWWGMNGRQSVEYKIVVVHKKSLKTSLE